MDFVGGVIGIIGGVAGVMFGLPGFNRATGDPLVVTYGVQLISVGGVSAAASEGALCLGVTGEPRNLTRQIWFKNLACVRPQDVVEGP